MQESTAFVEETPAADIAFYGCQINDELRTLVQLLLSFSALDFSRITHLENTIAYVSNWMSYNFLSLNPSKTEFLISGLSQQLSKLKNHLPNSCILSPVHSARNLGVNRVIFDKNLSFAKLNCCF